MVRVGGDGNLFSGGTCKAVEEEVLVIKMVSSQRSSHNIQAEHELEGKVWLYLECLGSLPRVSEMLQHSNSSWDNNFRGNCT